MFNVRTYVDCVGPLAMSFLCMPTQDTRVCGTLPCSVGVSDHLAPLCLKDFPIVCLVVLLAFGIKADCPICWQPGGPWPWPLASFWFPIWIMRNVSVRPPAASLLVHCRRLQFHFYPCKRTYIRNIHTFTHSPFFIIRSSRTPQMCYTPYVQLF